MSKRKGTEADARQDNVTSSTGKYARDIRWVNAELNLQDIKALESDLDGALEGVVRLYEGLQVNQRLSVKVDPRSGRWLAILFDHSEQEGDTVVALSLRAATPLDALMALAYVALVKSAGIWQDVDSEPRGRFN